MKINLDLNNFRTEQRVAMQLKGLFESYGYAPYKMSKFEEYELYSKNRDFIGDGSILTFTDTNGKLMALKPDVTLSIVKNSKSVSGIDKVYYNENVYRSSGKGESFKEIPQSGIECIGQIGQYEIFEVILLSIMSLELTGRPYRLEISHMGILSSLIDELNIPTEYINDLFTCIKRKNVSGIREIAQANGLFEISALEKAIEINGSVEFVLDRLRALNVPSINSAICELENIAKLLDELGYKDKYGIDLSVVNDMSYYRSLVFRGYIDCVPEGILFGGRYDDLVTKMGGHGGAIGFAVMLDKLQELSRNELPLSSDVLLFYNENSSLSEIIERSNQLRAMGLTVSALPYCEQKNEYGKVIYLNDNTEVTLEEE